MELNFSSNIIYDKTLYNCPECGSDKVSHTFFIPIKPTNKPPRRPEEKCKDCGFKSEYKFELLNKINRRTDKIDKILDKYGI